MTPESKQHIILIHGRGAKPNQADLQALWLTALQAGLKRDAPEKLDALARASIHMLYYADELDHLSEPGFDPALDLDNRRQALDELAARAKAKDFRRKHYEILPGKTALKEFAMDLSASVGLGRAAVVHAMPELKHYWQDESGWASALRERTTTLLEGLITAGDNVLVISHCMGSVLAWDALWQLSQRLHENPTPHNRITRWITTGSPLGDNSVQKNLLGHGDAKSNRYPDVLTAWHNIAAEDDYVCHDKTVADDFKGMLEQKLIGDIRDHTIYNLSVRYGRSNPHSSAGYLIHPRMAALLADWLS